MSDIEPGDFVYFRLDTDKKHPGFGFFQGSHSDPDEENNPNKYDCTVMNIQDMKLDKYACNHLSGETLMFRKKELVKLPSKIGKLIIA